METPPSLVFTRPQNSNRSNHPGFRNAKRSSMVLSMTTSSAEKRISQPVSPGDVSGQRSENGAEKRDSVYIAGQRQVPATKVKKRFNPNVAALTASDPITAGIPRKKESPSSSIISVSEVVVQDPARPYLCPTVAIV